uniref:tectonic-like complex member MKS1 isoform X2 n=1 Tax=Myxine glutinosa TaxID=7769 RepID=UPI00358ED7DF
MWRAEDVREAGEGIYRSRDPICNFKLRVRLTKASSAGALARRVQAQAAQVTASDTELATFRSSAAGQGEDEEEEEVVISWQQKLFSKYELELYRDPTFCLSPLERQYHEDLVKIEADGGLTTCRIFTYTENDPYTRSHELAESVLCGGGNYSTSTTLEERFATVRRRRPACHAPERGLSHMPLVNWESSAELLKYTHTIGTSKKTMLIMADLGPASKLGERNDERLLCTIQVDGNGVLIMKPDFSGSKGAYRLEMEGERHEVWNVTLIHESKGMRSEEREREQKMMRELYTRHSDYLASLVGNEFETPAPGIRRLLVNGEIVTAKGFEYDNLYVHFFVEFPKGWLVSNEQQLSWETQSCATISADGENTALFSFLFTIEACFTESEGSLSDWPTLYIEILSLDFWQRHRTEGYTYLCLPTLPGLHEMSCQAWRPLQAEKLVSSLRRFFIGGSPVLEDVSYVGIPSTFQGERLSRYGFRTEAVGSVNLKLHCVHQSRSLLEARRRRRSARAALAGLPGASRGRSVQSVLEAFQRAQRKMQQVREAVPRGLHVSVEPAA